VLYSTRAENPEDADVAALREALEALLRGVGMELVELGVFRGRAAKGGVQVRAVVYRPPSEGRAGMGTEDCARAHRAIMPALEGAFLDRELSLEVTTPGINRRARDGAELALYKGRGARCWRTDISGWAAGILDEADAQGITLKGKEGTIRLGYGIIAKAMLDPSQEG